MRRVGREEGIRPPGRATSTTQPGSAGNGLRRASREAAKARGASPRSGTCISRTRSPRAAAADFRAASPSTRHCRAGTRYRSVARNDVVSPVCGATVITAKGNDQRVPGHVIRHQRRLLERHGAGRSGLLCADRRDRPDSRYGRQRRRRDRGRSCASPARVVLVFSVSRARPHTTPSRRASAGRSCCSGRTSPTSRARAHRPRADCARRT